MLRACDTQVEQSLQKKLGNDRAGWTWGTASQARFSHPLAGVPFIGAQFAIPRTPIMGSGQTPNVGSAVSMRFIAMPGAWDETRHVIPLGESGDPTSPHFKDQFEPWRTGTPMFFPFSDAAVEKAAVERIEFVPATSK
jgi:penicillin amidase